MNAQISLRRPSASAVLASACMALSLVVPLAASADPPASRTPVLQSSVALSDLDLSTPQGMRVAQKRLREKAEHLCRQLEDSSSSTYRWTHAACVRDTLANAIQQLNAPALAATEHNASGPQPAGLGASSAHSSPSAPR